ncbi:phage tail tube protein [Achromobacter sp. UBA2119]|uniref:phage tail tube protein n=1 Tax=Achromobacter sp. UBA2119 TaxID=1945911 RepID=UPI00257F3DCF|nr:phage tail tube protein [Achromobacter sp. UBA2119]
MGQKVAGTVYFKVDGEQLEVTGAVEAPTTDSTRESLRPGFFSETDRVPYVKVDALFTPGFPMKKLQDATDMTVTAEFKNGRTYVLSEAYQVGEPVVSGDDGKIQLQFDGVKGVWQ